MRTKTRFHQPIVYLCHAFGADVMVNAADIRELSREIAISGVLPLAPQLLLPQFLDEATERHFALKFCLRLVGVCDEVRVYGQLSAGMRLEIAEARRLGIPVVAGDEAGMMALTGEPPR